MTDFLYPPRHSPPMPARCRHPRGHEGDHWFGIWRGNGYMVALDTAPPLGDPAALDPRLTGRISE